MKLLFLPQIATRLEQRRERKPISLQAIENHLSVEKNRFARTVPVRVASYDGITSKNGGVGDLAQHKTGVIETPRVLKSAEGDDLAGGEGVEEETGSEHLGVDLLELGHVGAFF